jgi:hypothetical protein
MPANATLDFESAPVDPHGLPTNDLSHEKDVKNELDADVVVSSAIDGVEDPAVDADSVPTEEQLATLRKVSAPLP